MLGSARKVIAEKDSTTLVEGYGNESAIKERIAQIRAQAENATSEYDKENLEKRLSALAGKVAVIKVGGATETEIEEKKFRVDDAVAATKAAVAEGIVTGGGVTLVYAAREIARHLDAHKDMDEHERAGWVIVMEALEQPFKQLMRNAGLNAEEKLAKVLAQESWEAGFDINDSDELKKDLKKQGIVDPAKVTREAIQNAVSVAGTAMTMGALIVELPEEKPAAPMGGGMPGGMGMDY
jgi:chaperonin GroEL